jgi:nitroreductase
MLDTVGDDGVAALLGLDRDADYQVAERERPECLLWVGPDEPPAIDALVAAARAAHWAGAANRLSTAHVEWPDIDLAHAATRKPQTTRSDARPGVAFDLAAPKLDLAASTLFRQRRSAVDFDAVTSIPADAFYTMLDPLLPRAGVPPWNAWPWAPRVHLGLFVHRVEGLEPGLYAFLRVESARGALRQALSPEWLWREAGPAHLPLYLLLPHDTRDTARVVCCHQDIAADSCFALGMLSDFAGIEESPWRYRNLYWECGLVGQTLYLEAEAAGIRATGIGCFFDDEMHRVLGLEGHAWQSLYHFTAGGAVDDPRLTTLPAYGPRGPE